MFTPASPAQRAKLPSPIEKKRGDGQERRCSHRHRPHSGRNSRRQSRRSTGTARSAGPPASPAQRAKLPSPIGSAGTAWSAGVHTGIARRWGPAQRPQGRGGADPNRWGGSRLGTYANREEAATARSTPPSGRTLHRETPTAIGSAARRLGTPTSPAQRAKLLSSDSGEGRGGAHRHRPHSGRNVSPTRRGGAAGARERPS